jgi:hypothetical protein
VIFLDEKIKTIIVEDSCKLGFRFYDLTNEQLDELDSVLTCHNDVLGKPKDNHFSLLKNEIASCSNKILLECVNASISAPDILGKAELYFSDFDRMSIKINY